MAVFIKGRKNFDSQKQDINTLLLIEGKDIKDSSRYEIQLTNIGSVTAGNTQSHFGKGSLYFNGSSRLDLPQSFTFDFSTNSFTVDWWQYQTASLSGGNPFCFARDPLHFLDHITGGYHTLYYASLNGIILTTQKLNQWIHYAFVKNGSSLLFFENGSRVYSASNTDQIPAVSTYIKSIGGRSDTPQYYIGYLEEFRVSNVPRWTSNFTPPIRPY